MCSYVEDAVDYPPNQGNNLYAGVQGKQQKNPNDFGDGYNVSRITFVHLSCL